MSGQFAVRNMLRRWSSVGRIRNVSGVSAIRPSKGELNPSLEPGFHSHYCCTLGGFYSTSHNATIPHARGFADDASKAKDRWCWSCKDGAITASGLFCLSCRAIQPLDSSVDNFQIFEIERSFNVDPKALEQRYKDLQKRLHPDLAASKSKVEQEYSAEQSSHVIRAYYTLLRPLSRAQYLLRLHGIEVETEGTIEDPELLMEIMEIRESVEEASDVDALKKAQTDNNKRIQKCEKDLETTFRTMNMRQAVSQVRRLTYYDKVREEILRKL